MDSQILRAKIKAQGKWGAAMPNTQRHFVERGVEFGRYYSSNPICAPSRATLLSGRSTHNHGMLINAGPFGFQTWRNSPLYSSNLATWMQDGGYRTAHVGKFMNGYTSADEVPPGWDQWITPIVSAGAAYYGASLNINGRISEPIGSWRSKDKRDCVVAIPTKRRACNHATDVQTAFALREIRKLSSSRKPLFLALDFNAPHDDGRPPAGPEPPARYRNLVSRVKPLSDIGDGQGNESKPDFIRDLAPLNSGMKQEIRDRYAHEVVAMRAVDDSVGRIFSSLERRGELDNTYVLFMSDNGFFHGEHRIAYGKYLPHEPATRQPLLIAGPRIAQGRKTKALSSNLDIASTVMSMARLRRTSWVDGRSLLPYARNPKLASAYPVLLEGFNGGPLDDPGPFSDGSGAFKPNQAVVTNYTGFVAGRWKYIRYYYGDDELYDLFRDPDERFNLARDAGFGEVLDWASVVSSQLAQCQAGTCRFEVSPPRRP